MYHVIIIGGACSGLTSSLYTSRQGLLTLVITKDIGGQALLTNDIENYPAFEHIGGFELMSKFEQHAKSFGTEFIYEEVASIMEDESSCFTIKTSNNNEYSGCVIILAFGKTPTDLNVPGEKELKGRGVSYCAVCDGPFFKNKTVAVVGAGDPALEAAIYLKDLVQLNGNKEIIVDKYCATSNEGIFAAGDVTDVPCKQAIVSAGQGAIAALSAYNYIQKLKGKP